MNTKTQIVKTILKNGCVLVSIVSFLNQLLISLMDIDWFQTLKSVKAPKVPLANESALKISSFPDLNSSSGYSFMEKILFPFITTEK